MWYIDSVCNANSSEESGLGETGDFRACCNVICQVEFPEPMTVIGGPH